MSQIFLAPYFISHLSSSFLTHSSYLIPHICYIVPGFCADDSDWCIPVLKNFIERMARELEAVVYTPHYPYRRSTYRVFGATVHCLSDRKEAGVRRLLLWRELERRVAREHAAAPFDLIHAFWATETGYLATRIASRLGIPSIVSIGGGELARFPRENYGSQLGALQRYLVRGSFARATAITAGSQWVAARVPEEFRSKLSTIPLGVDTRMFAPGTLRSGRRLVTAMSFIALKNYPTLLKAVAEARKSIPDITLDIAGDGVERPHIEEMIGAYGLGDIIRLRGNVPHEEMPDLYHRSDLLLHSSLYESQGMAILEGLATGLPVVASNVGIAAELPDDLLYRFDPRDASAMAAMIVRSLSSPEHARHAFTAGPGLVRERFSLEGEHAIFLDLYRSLTGRDLVRQRMDDPRSTIRSSAGPHDR